MRWLVLLLVAGCYGPVDTAWTASFQNPSDNSDNVFVFVDVRDVIIDCPGDLDDIVRGPYQIQPAAPAGTIPVLDSGDYCFHATAVDGDTCERVAEGTLLVEVPRDEVHVVMGTASGGGCSSGETCESGRCVRTDGMPVCALGSAYAYCGEANVCCPGADEAAACDHFDNVTVGCMPPLE